MTSHGDWGLTQWVTRLSSAGSPWRGGSAWGRGEAGGGGGTSPPTPTSPTARSYINTTGWNELIRNFCLRQSTDCVYRVWPCRGIMNNNINSFIASLSFLTKCSHPASGKFCVCSEDILWKLLFVNFARLKIHLKDFPWVESLLERTSCQQEIATSAWSLSVQPSHSVLLRVSLLGSHFWQNSDFYQRIIWKYFQKFS